MAEQKAKVVKVGRGGPRGPRPKVQNPGKIFMRILRYVMECYRIQVVAVVICIFVSVFVALKQSSAHITAVTSITPVFDSSLFFI